LRERGISKLHETLSQSILCHSFPFHTPSLTCIYPRIFLISHSFLSYSLSSFAQASFLSLLRKTFLPLAPPIYVDAASTNASMYPTPNGSDLEVETRTQNGETPSISVSAPSDIIDAGLKSLDHCKCSDYEAHFSRLFQELSLISSYSAVRIVNVRKRLTLLHFNLSSGMVKSLSICPTAQRAHYFSIVHHDFILTDFLR
jgi:hypothetical protein